MQLNHLEYFPHWPYDDALTWMANAHERVRADNRQIFVGCGSHVENVVTLGRDHKKNVVDEAFVRSHGNTICRTIDRGGGATAHEPGQIVLYPIFHLAYHGFSPVQLVDILQTSMVQFLGNFGLAGEKDVRGPGVFVGGQKIGFIGMRIKEGISTHGIALNVFNDAKTFSYFDPCGLRELKVTSLRYLVDIHYSLSELMTQLAAGFLRNLPPCGTTRSLLSIEFKTTKL